MINKDIMEYLDQDNLEQDLYRLELSEILNAYLKNAYTLNELKQKKKIKEYNILFDNIVKELEETCKMFNHDSIISTLNSQIEND